MICELNLGGPADVRTLTAAERSEIDNGRWFSSLSSALRDDILKSAFVRRFEHAEQIVARGAAPKAWFAFAKGSVRIGTTSESGRELTLSYVRPGVWFGDVEMLDGNPSTHDAFAHTETTILCIARSDVQRTLATHPELHAALGRLHARRMRMLFGLVEDLSTLPLRARLAKLLVQLARGHNKTMDAGMVRTGLSLAQGDLARLLGASRQRVNLELKAFERRGIVRIAPEHLQVLALPELIRIVGQYASAPSPTWTTPARAEFA